MSRLALLAALVALAPLPIAFRPVAQGVDARPVPLDPSDPGRRDLGRLHYLGGWVLKGTDQRFGGISSMTLEDGLFTLLSDGGVVTRLHFTGTGRQADYAMTELPAPGDPTHKAERDSESSTYDPVTGHVWAGFETTNQIWRYTKGFAQADGHVAPKAMETWPTNEGAEAMVRLRDGRFIVFAETRKRKDGSHLVLLFPGDPVDGGTPIEFGYDGPGPGFAPTDAAQLPDGRVVVLNRRFGFGSGFSAALVIIDPKEIAAGTVVKGKVIARLAPPLTVDNMEALAIQQRAGKTILWVASDDNYFFLERTLLLAFELPAGV